jgi:plasmid stabilization system protein ParE
MVTVWSALAKTQLNKAFKYIFDDSPQSAEKVRDGIIELSLRLPIHPEKYPLDKYKLNNDGTYRAFEVFRYRISYRILKDHVRIVRLRHTSMSPLGY